MKRNIIILTLVALFFGGCRKEADYFPYLGEEGTLAYTSYASQFDYLWKCISMGYVFWDIEKTDWDAVYEDLMPQFEALDAKYKAGGDVTVDDLETLYNRALGGMVDHHMTVVVRNIHPSPNDTKPAVAIRPGQNELATRDYFIESVLNEKVSIRAFLDGIDGQYSLAAHQTATGLSPALGDSVTYHYCLINLPDGRKIPYLWQSAASLTSIIPTLGSAADAAAAAAVVDSWFKAIDTLPREKLAGIILDNRSNSGGETMDVNYIIGSFLNETAVWGENRTKEGPGRFEHTAWIPTYVFPAKSCYHRDLTAENIPYVVLCDINSISMGEIEPSVIKTLLPTGYIIGERTCGATGSLMPANNIDLTYGGPFGDLAKMNHYVYTSTMECKIGGINREGIGLVPDKIVNRKDYGGSFKPQLDEAIQYIQGY